LAVSINRPSASGRLADYEAAPLAVKTGASTTKSLTLDGNEGALIEASATLSIQVGGFFQVDGGFALRRSTGNVTLSDGSTIAADLLTLGGAGVSAFAGLDGGTADQAGLSLGQVNFALALISDRADPSRKFTSLQATAGVAALLGADSLLVSGTNLAVAVNRGLQANQAAIAAASGNTTYRLNLGPDTFGSLEFRKTGVATAATAAIGYDDSDAAVAGKVRTALESLTGIGAGNVTVTGGRASGFTIAFIGTLAGTDVAGLSVTTPSTVAGTVSSAMLSASRVGVSETQTIAISAPRQAAPTVSTAVSRVTAGQAAFGQVSRIVIEATSGTTGQYQLSYNSATRSVRFAASDVTNNARYIKEALQALTGDSGVKVVFDQKSTTTRQVF
jgi:hypothetical protein